MIELICDKNRAFFRETEKLTSGSIGVTINFVFSHEWDGLLKTAVFEAGDVKNDVVLTSESCEIPPDVLACPYKQLFVGVFGELADKTLVIPTIYAAAGIIKPGASPSGMTSAPPSPSWPEQVQAIALEAKEVADSVRSDADAGKFNGQAGADGGWYTPAVTQPNANTMRVAFTPSKEGMPEVPPKDITIPGGGGITVDDTLTVSGAAADAKAVGEKINSLSEEIANIGGGAGLTTAQINALDGMFKVAAYDDSKDVSGAYAAFKSAFGLVDSGVTTYTITADLVNVTSSNSATSITEGESYTATLTAADGYALDTVTVTMGGVDVTADVYADGVISIPAVTGNVEIIASAVQVEEVAPELSEDSLSAYFDFRNVAILASEHYAATKGVDGAYFTTSYDTTVNDDKGIMFDNGPYGGGYSGGFNINTEHFTFGILFYTTETRCAVLPVNIGGVSGIDVQINWHINYLDSSGTSTSAATLNENVFSAGKYVFVAYRTTAEQADIFVDGSLKLTATSDGLTDFATWAKPGTIRATKNFGNGQVTALAYYDRALSDVEIVELGEYFKTLEVSV